MDDKPYYSGLDYESDVGDGVAAENEALLSSWARRTWTSYGNWKRPKILGLVSSATALVLLLWLFASSSPGARDISLAHTKNGTYCGTYNSEFDQHLFLGMPYAQTPVDSLRFRPAQSLNNSWEGVRRAGAYGNRCIAFGAIDNLLPHSEDCLTINVIRPVVSVMEGLPVGVYIYGGGSNGGSSVDGRYNLSYIVSHATQHGLPFIGVSFNYRSSLWGFINSREVMGTGNSNLGLRDQRLALHWVQENIAAFGGDPRKVTIWGGSSGADNVGLHLTAYGGRDDGLFRAAILQSGGPVTRTGYRQVPAQQVYDRLVSMTSCSEPDDGDTLKCLRRLPLSSLNAAFNDSAEADSAFMTAMSVPALDGDFIQGYGSLSVKDSRFVNVPVLSGVVTNEGSSWIPDGIQSWEDLRTYLSSYRRYPAKVVDRLLSFYPNISAAEQMPLDPPIHSIHDFYLHRRIESVFGDLELNAAQRLLCGAYSISSVCYSFRFDAVSSENLDSREGVMHGNEIGPVFQNFKGLGYQRNPFEGKGNGYYQMSELMGLMWAGFITSLNPNAAVEANGVFWPHYDLRRPQNLVFNDSGPTVEEDTYRWDAMRYINEIQQSVLDM